MCWLIMACYLVFTVPLKSSISQLRSVAELAQGRGEGMRDAFNSTANCLSGG